MLFISATVSSGSKTLVSSRISRPSMRSTGGWPTVMCKSLALRLTTVWSSLSIRIVAIAASSPLKVCAPGASGEEVCPVALFRKRRACA